MLKHDYTLECAGAVDRRTGQIYVNPRLFYPLTSFEKKFVLLHEEAHYKLNTNNESRCDAYAFDRLAGTEFQSLKKSIATLQTLLRDGNPGKAERLWAIYIKALKWDSKHGNPRATQELRRIGNRSALSYFDSSLHAGEPGYSIECHIERYPHWYSPKTSVCNWIYDSQKAAQEKLVLAQAEDQESLTDSREKYVDDSLDDKDEPTASGFSLDSNTSTVLIIIALIWLVWRA